MVAITATNSATPSPQAALGRARVEQARREADQAEANAQSLRSRADAAELEAQNSQERAREVAQRNRQSDPTYTPQLNASKSEVPQKTQEFLVNLYSASEQKFAASGNPLKTYPNAAPVRNTQGQATGRIVNLST
ncbi:MAG: hypothetical protein A3F78_02360 [Burkholderiales bacterium RIFCSPLOWO2_12_FULL_61_40]|nr:MAG: hypothetical protein A3F78_02360 [Burkholderiales bacterium RIFCSPLOWO2_12_FULL_61_40]